MLVNRHLRSQSLALLPSYNVFHCGIQNLGCTPSAFAIKHLGTDRYMKDTCVATVDAADIL